MYASARTGFCPVSTEPLDTFTFDNEYMYGFLVRPNSWQEFTKSLSGQISWVILLFTTIVVEDLVVNITSSPKKSYWYSDLNFSIISKCKAWFKLCNYWRPKMQKEAEDSPRAQGWQRRIPIVGILIYTWFCGPREKPTALQEYIWQKFFSSHVFKPAGDTREKGCSLSKRQ